MRIHSKAVPLAILLILLGATASSSAGSGIPSIALEQPGSERDSRLIPDQVVILFRGPVPEDVKEGLSDAGAVVQIDDTLRFVTLEVEPSSVAATIQMVATRDDVELAYQPSYLVAQWIPNDAGYPYQWAPPTIALPAAWDVTRGSHAVKIAVLDSGVSYMHPDLQENTMLGDAECGPDISYYPAEIAPPFFGVSPLALDDHGHGTHVAGILAGVTNNGIGIAGTSQSCVQAIKVLDSQARGASQAVALGITHATVTGAKVITMSLGSDVPDPLIERAVQWAWDQGVLLVAGAGNIPCSWTPAGEAISSILYPARYPEVIAVTALATPTTRVGWSGCGPEAEIAAPGVEILSTCIAEDVVPHLGGGYCTKSGTSMATPFVSGVAALMFDVDDGLTNIQARCILAATAYDVESPGWDVNTGFGRVDAGVAVLASSSPGDVGC